MPRIFTLWQHDGSDVMPWIVDAVDEYTMEEVGGFPEEYAKKKAADPKLRELVIDIPDDAVRRLFHTPVVKGKVEQG